jgi:co-chaperonin GroES (HSP10)
MSLMDSGNYGSDKPQTSLDEVMAGIGPALDKVLVATNHVLVGIWMRPERTAGGIILTPKTRDEDKWQGKVGFVLKKGAIAFKSDDRNDFGDLNPDVGDCVLYRTNDGFSVDVNGVHCRMIEDVHVKAVVPNPEMIW